MRRLPETDLARIAPLPIDQQRRQLNAFRFGQPPYYYKPVHRTWGDILNVQLHKIYGPQAPTPWEKIDGLIRSRARSEVEYEANILIAASLHERALHEKWKTVNRHIPQVSLGAGMKMGYWLNFVIDMNGQPLVPFFDPRRNSMRLTEQGRRFAFSVMHEYVRVADPDLAHVRLGIFQFDQLPGGGRRLRLYTDENVIFFSHEELEHMTNTTYAIWRDVLANRKEETRKRAGAERGSLI